MNQFRIAVLLGCFGVAGCVLPVECAAGATGQEDQKDRTNLAGATSPNLTTIASVRRGAVVDLSGEVIRVTDRDEFRLSDGTNSITVRIAWSGPAPVAVGDRVQVKGLVVDEMTFGLSRPEVIANTLRLPSGATVQFDAPRPVPTAEADTEQNIPIGRLARGQSATISGHVTAILDTDEFRLEDASGSVRVYVGWQNTMGVRTGDAVTVVGTLDDEPWPLPAEFYAEAVTLSEGRLVELPRETSALSARDADAATSKPVTAASNVDTSPAVMSRIADVRAYDTVLLRGVVERITDEDEFRLRDDSGSIGVYIGWRNAMPVAAGERISVIGIVDTKGPAGLWREVYAHEVTTADGRRVELQPRRDAARLDAPTSESARNQATTAGSETAPSRGKRANEDAVLTPIREVRRGQFVTLNGEVQRLRDTDEFVLRDDSGAITVYIGWRNRMPVSVGQRITVVGTADDDVVPGFRPEIYASHIVLPDGRTVELIPGDRNE